MGYKRVDFMDIYDIIRRWHAGQKISHIAQLCAYDRKTIRKYITMAQQIGLSPDQPLPAKEDLLKRLEPFLVQKTQKPIPAQSTLTTYLEELAELINKPPYTLKPKIAFEVICERHDLYDKVSYSSFKRFVKDHPIAIHPQHTTCRIEVPPGSEVQIDYGSMGLLFDPLLDRKRKVYAFIATLSHSRHQFVEFVYKQNQQSFAASHVKMFSYFGGVPSRLRIDNLKAGVLKPDLYEPTLNYTYRELAEHYDCFIDPCRVGHPQDKGKVENQVPVVRQQFRKQLALNSNLDIGMANHLITEWCLGKHGHRIHGTTQWQPYPTFLHVEQPALKPLPADPFDLPLWKKARVHPDQYIQFEKIPYSVPQQFVGKNVWVRGTDKLVQVFYKNRVIKQHLIVPNCYRYTDHTDFPENVRAVLGTGYHKFLLNKAARTGTAFGQLIKQILEAHAFINLRKVQSLVSLSEKFDAELVDKTAAIVLEKQLSVSPASFKKLLHKLQDEKQTQEHISISQQTQLFLRPMDYFVRHP